MDDSKENNSKNNRIVRLSIELPEKLRSSFKAKLAEKGQNMTDVITLFIKDYVEKAEKAGIKGRG